MHRLSPFILATFLAAVALCGAEGRAPKTATVKGYVVDSACAFTKNLKKPASVQCATECAKAGSPLVILTEDGGVYWPISGSLPATGENQKLLKFVGQKVVASGEVFDKGGSRAIVIKEIRPSSKGR